MYEEEKVKSGLIGKGTLKNKLGGGEERNQPSPIRSRLALLIAMKSSKGSSQL
jgi:hypothetical protein